MAEINALKATGCKSNNIFISDGEKAILKEVQNHFEGIESQFLHYDSKLEKWFSYDIRYKNKIIEYHGDYWHCNPIKYKENYYHSQQRKTAREIWDKDCIKKQSLINHNYELLVVWESDYKKDKEGTIEKCQILLMT